MCTTVHKIKPSCSLLSLYRITLDINRGKSSDKMNNLSLAWITKTQGLTIGADERVSK